ERHRCSIRRLAAGRPEPSARWSLPGSSPRVGWRARRWRPAATPLPGWRDRSRPPGPAPRRGAGRAIAAARTGIPRSTCPALLECRGAIGEGHHQVTGGGQVGVLVGALLQESQQFRPESDRGVHQRIRSEEHTSELQSREKLVCRLLLEKKKNRLLKDEQH